MAQDIGIVDIAKATVSALGLTFRNLFRKPVTVQYPAVKRPIPQRWRGGTFALTIDPKTGEENCIGCKLCEKICPSEIIVVEMEKHSGRGWAKGFILNLQACLQCELCVQVCPTDAIVMLYQLGTVTSQREDLILNKEKLMENGSLYQAAWATGIKLQRLHTPPKPEVKKEEQKKTQTM